MEKSVHDSVLQIFVSSNVPFTSVAPPTKPPPGSNIVKLLALITWSAAFTGDKANRKKRIEANFRKLTILVLVILCIITDLWNRFSAHSYKWAERKVHDFP
jgi:hypothetical protein